MPIHAVIAGAMVVGSLATGGAMIYKSVQDGKRFDEAKKLMDEKKSDPAQMAMLQQMWQKSQQDSMMLQQMYGMRPGGQFAGPQSFGPAPGGYYPQYAQWGPPQQFQGGPQFGGPQVHPGARWA